MGRSETVIRSSGAAVSSDGDPMAARGLRLTLALVFLSRVFSENPQSVHEPSGKETRNSSVEISRRNSDLPNFAEPIQNITVPVGREAVLTCLVEQLGAYKVAWLRVDTQTILTIHGHVITKNHRIGVTHSDHRSWCLHIKEIRESDRGWYMCQINTDPMKSQVGFLDVVVPPDIVDVGTSTDMIVREGANVTFTCSASGSPAPNITWRREAGQTIPTSDGHEVPSIDGVGFNLTGINRLHMGAYLCIASNGWPPSVSKRIMLIVHFPPMIWIQNQLVGAMEGERMTLECLSEAFPRSINYWTRETGEIISQGSKFDPSVVENSYKIHMKLTILNVALVDFGSYKCVSKNSLGETDGTIKLYQIPTPTTTTTTVATTMTREKVLSTTEPPRTTKPERRKSKERKKVVHEVNEIAPISSEDRRLVVLSGPIKIEENRHETKMDRAHYPMAHESSSAPKNCLVLTLLPLQALILLTLNCQ